MSPSAVFNPTTKTVSIVMPGGAVWATDDVWDPGVVWGTTILSASGAESGSGKAWGTKSPHAADDVWDPGVVWGTGAPKSEAVAIIINGEK